MTKREIRKSEHTELSIRQSVSGSTFTASDVELIRIVLDYVQHGNGSREVITRAAKLLRFIVGY